MFNKPTSFAKNEASFKEEGEALSAQFNTKNNSIIIISAIIIA